MVRNQRQRPACGVTPGVDGATARPYHKSGTKSERSFLCHQLVKHVKHRGSIRSSTISSTRNKSQWSKVRNSPLALNAGRELPINWCKPHNIDLNSHSGSRSGTRARGDLAAPEDCPCRRAGARHSAWRSGGCSRNGRNRTISDELH